MDNLINDAISKGLISIVHAHTFGERICEILESGRGQFILAEIPLFLIAMEDEVHNFWYWQSFIRVNNN